VAAICSTGAFADPIYSVAPVLTPGFTGIQIYQINDSGQVVGYGDNASGHPETFLANTSTDPSAIPLPPGWLNLQGWGVNDSGVVAASGPNSSVTIQAATGTTSGSTAVPTPSGGWTGALGLGISDTGYVTGYASKTGLSLPFLYNPNTGISQTIALPSTGGWTQERGVGVNDSGQVTGWVYNGIDYEPFIGTPGTGTTVIPLPTGWISAQGASINDSGQVAGYGFNSSGTSFAFIGTSSGSMAIPLPTGATDAETSSDTTGILNNAGDIVGFSNAGGWIWDATDGTLLLNPLLVTSGWNITDAISISNNGLILALGTYEGGSSQWVELTPQTTGEAPEPATLLLSGAGLAAVILRRRLSRA
jgi:PEP-CTERM motif